MLTGTQIKVIEELLKGDSTKKAIAERNNITPRTISNWIKNDQEFKEAYNTEVQAMLTEASAEAVATLIDLMRNAESDTVRLNASKDILSRAGFDATMKNKIDLDAPNNIVINISDD